MPGCRLAHASADAAVCGFTIFASVASHFLSKTMPHGVAVSVIDAIQGCVAALRARGAGRNATNKPRVYLIT